VALTGKPNDYGHRGSVLPVSWNTFHGICKGLVRVAASYQPEIILAVGRGGFYPGTLMAHILRTEIHPIRISRRVNDVVIYEHPQWITPPPAEVRNQRILIVDEICDSGETLTVVKDRVISMGAAEVRCAVLYAHTLGASIPDYIGIITDALLLNPWDREIWVDGDFHFHSEYAGALAQQGLEPGPSMLVDAPEIKAAKG
jgi:hypoxanthine phosphoribosyltransferase